jgi:hypothetical protein
MSENIKNVMSVDPQTIVDQHQQKAVLAMRATTLFGTEQFDDANNKLIELAGSLGAAATMTYEDLIFVNPVETNPYVISPDPGVASQEALFYASHKAIEDTLAEGIDALRLGEFNRVIETLQVAIKSFGGMYRKLDPEAFKSFRPYFIGINGHPGPSGLFTAAVPIIDLLGHGGSNIAEQERTRLLNDIETGLYPSHQSGILKELLLADDPQVDLPQTTQYTINMLLNRFRNVHTKTVEKFVPQALNAGAEGSGGTKNVSEYLESKVIETKGEIR